MQSGDFRIIKTVGIAIFLTLFALLVIVLLKRSNREEQQACMGEEEALSLHEADEAFSHPIGFKYLLEREDTVSTRRDI